MTLSRTSLNSKNGKFGELSPVVNETMINTCEILSFVDTVVNLVYQLCKFSLHYPQQNKLLGDENKANDHTVHSNFLGYLIRKTKFIQHANRHVGTN